MRIVGISGSPKKEKSNTQFLLSKALEATSADTHLINISEYDIRHCTGCDSCVRKKPCPQSEHDDMPKIEDELRKADAIIIAAPSYFTSVPGVLKDFIDPSIERQDLWCTNLRWSKVWWTGTCHRCVESLCIGTRYDCCRCIRKPCKAWYFWFR